MRTRNEYEVRFGNKSYIAYYEVATTLEILDRRINEIVSCSRLFSSYNTRKDLLLNLAKQKDTMITEGILAGSIVEVKISEKRKAA
jgi:hypothetical protein